MPPVNSVRDLLLWLLGILAIWIILSIPGYGFLSVWLKLREALKSTIQRFKDKIKEGNALRAQSAAATRQNLLERTTLVEVDQIAASVWRKTLDTILGGVRSGGIQIEKTRTLALQTTKELQQTTQRLRKLEIVATKVPEIPSVQEALLHGKRNRLASVNLFLGLSLVVVIMGANAQLTGLVLAELMPPYQPLFGIPLAYILALIIVLAEAAIGVLHSTEAEKRAESERKFTVETVIWNLAAIGVIAVETLLYAQVQPGSGVLKLPIGGSALALVGALLGLVVFGLGRLAHSSIATLRKDRTPKVITKQLIALKESAEDWNLVADRIQPAQKACIEHFEHLVDLSQQTSKSQEYAVQKFRNEVATLGETPPAWAEPKERPLTQSEFSERESRGYLWFSIALIATLSLTLVCAPLAARLSLYGGAAVGLGLAAAAFAAGALGSQNAPQQKSWRLIWYVALLTVVVLATVGSIRFMRGSVRAQFAILIIPTLAVFIAGIQIGPSVSFLRLPLLWLTNRVVDAVLIACLLLLRLAAVVTALIEYAAELIAWPTMVVVKALWSKA